MTVVNVSRKEALRGSISVPGDKSISHRLVMFGAIADGITEGTGFLMGADCLSTIRCFQNMGIQIEANTLNSQIVIHGKGLHGLTLPDSPLDTGNSGTTTRLLSGILAGQPFDSVLSGDASLNTRPMTRIIEPLTKMGAQIHSEKNNGCAPLIISPAPLHGISYASPVASAQVKSAILLAGLYAEGNTTVIEPALSRDHTERMLQGFGATLQISASKKDSLEPSTSFPAVTLSPGRTLHGLKMQIPGDISSAAYFIAAGLLVPNSQIRIQNVGINPTRAGILTVCAQMGAHIEQMEPRISGGEPVCDLLVHNSCLHGTQIGGTLIPTLIDEIPILAVMAACAEGTTVIKDAAELKFKETNRIDTVCENLAAMGVDITPTEDGMIIHGGKPLCGATIHTHRDHRIAMAFAIAGLVADGITSLDDAECMTVSYPGFMDTLRQLV